VGAYQSTTKSLRAASRMSSREELGPEVSEYERNRTFALRVVEGTPIHGRITFEETKDGTVMRFRVHGQLGGAMRLLQPLARPALRRQFGEYCATLKGVLESNSGTGEPPAIAG
jgi:hypothetical protein